MPKPYLRPSAGAGKITSLTISQLKLVNKFGNLNSIKRIFIVRDLSFDCITLYHVYQQHL